MIEQEITLLSDLGLHARPSALITGSLEKMDLKYAEIHYGELKANLKSVMDLLMLGIPSKAKVIVRIEGKDEIDAFKVVEKVFSTEEKGIHYA